jgi:integrase
LNAILRAANFLRLLGFSAPSKNRLFPAISPLMVVSGNYWKSRFGVAPVLPRATAGQNWGARTMDNQRVTKRLVDGLRPRKIDYTVWDSDVRGFGVRVRMTGAKSYVLVYRHGSGRSAPLRRVTLARVGDVTPEQARTLAEKHRGAIAHGADPATVKAAERHADTLSDFAKVYLVELVGAKRKASTAEQYRDALERFVLPELGSRKLGKITVAEIAKLHGKMAGTPYQANRMLAVVGSLYTFAAQRHAVPHSTNPTRGIEKYPEEGRERFLSTEELARLGDAIREAETIGLAYAVDETKPKAKHAPKAKNRRTMIGPHAAAAMRLLILTGARLREILHLRWDHVDFESGMLLLPDSKTGKKAIVRPGARRAGKSAACQLLPDCRAGNRHRTGPAPRGP